MASLASETLDSSTAIPPNANLGRVNILHQKMRMFVKFGEHFPLLLLFRMNALQSVGAKGVFRGTWRERIFFLKIKAI